MPEPTSRTRVARADRQLVEERRRRLGAADVELVDRLQMLGRHLPGRDAGFREALHDPLVEPDAAVVRRDARRLDHRRSPRRLSRSLLLAGAEDSTSAAVDGYDRHVGSRVDVHRGVAALGDGGHRQVVAARGAVAAGPDAGAGWCGRRR